MSELERAIEVITNLPSYKANTDAQRPVERVVGQQRNINIKVTHWGTGTRFEIDGKPYELARQSDGGFNLLDDTGHYAMSQGFYPADDSPNVEYAAGAISRYLVK